MIQQGAKGSMSGIEIIGLVASASQLALYSIKITTCLGEICQRVQNAPARIRHHSDQLRQLVSTAQLVQEHRLLQTAHVHAHINATLEQARTLSAILEQLTIDYSRGSIRRYWKILKATREKEIQANFDRLEKEKIALILCISVAQTDLLGQGIHKLEMAEKEARQPSVVAEEGNRVSLPHWMFCVRNIIGEKGISHGCFLADRTKGIRSDPHGNNCSQGTANCAGNVAQTRFQRH